MKLFRVLLMCLALTTVFSGLAEAGRADSFRGFYPILSDTEGNPHPIKYFLLDADTLGAIWGKYSSSPLPPDLEQYRNEPTVFTAFTHRDLNLLALERGALIGTNYLAIQGGNGEKLEFRRRPDGNADMAVKEGDRVFTYLLGPAEELPTKH